MNTIVAVADGFAIGKNGDLLVRLPEDLRRFKELTTDKVVVMGYNTFLSLPGSRPLKNRTNIVLCPDQIEIEGATVVHDIPALLELLRIYPTEDVFIIGGGMVYASMLRYCDRAFVTRIYKSYEADTFFPDLDSMPEWRVLEKSEHYKTDEGTEYCYMTYVRKNR